MNNVVGTNSGVVALVVKVVFRMIYEDDNASNADFSRIVMEKSQLNTGKMGPKTQELEVFFVLIQKLLLLGNAQRDL
jgi:hypothetical protein